MCDVLGTNNSVKYYQRYLGSKNAAAKTKGKKQREKKLLQEKGKKNLPGLDRRVGFLVFFTHRI